MADLHKQGLAYYVSPTANVSVANVRSSRIGFVISDVDHDTTSIKYFSMFLVVP